MSKTCTFTRVDFYMGEGSNTWECSECEDVFYFDEGSPQENHYNYCPNCGAKITKAVWPYPEDVGGYAN